MKTPRWISLLSAFLFGRRGQVAAGLPLQVRNLTRQTVLADCLEVANTSARRSRGLLGRTQLKPGQGLWIVPCESVHTLGMQFPIDLVYLDRKHRIRKLRSNVRPWRISACLSAHSVLELPVGVIQESQSARGDTLGFLGLPGPSAPLP